MTANVRIPLINVLANVVNSEEMPAQIEEENNDEQNVQNQ